MWITVFAAIFAAIALLLVAFTAGGAKQTKRTSARLKVHPRGPAKSRPAAEASGGPGGAGFQHASLARPAVA